MSNEDEVTIPSTVLPIRPTKFSAQHKTLAWALKQKWERESDRTVFVYLCSLAIYSNNMAPHASYRTIRLNTNLSYTTISKSISRLIQNGLIVLVKHHSRNPNRPIGFLHANSYDIIPHEEEIPMEGSESLAGLQGLDMFTPGGIGRSALTIWQWLAMNMDGLTQTEICQKTNKSRSSVSRKLNLLLEHGLVSKDGKKYFARGFNHSEIEKHLGVDGHAELRRNAILTQRIEYRERIYRMFPEIKHRSNPMSAKTVQGVLTVMNNLRKWSINYRITSGELSTQTRARHRARLGWLTRYRNMENKIKPKETDD